MHYAAVLHQYGGKPKDVNSNLYNFDESNMAFHDKICQSGQLQSAWIGHKFDFCTLAERELTGISPISVK